jgi:serine/threonine protein kinase
MTARFPKGWAMPAPANIEAFLELGLKSGLLERPALEEYRHRLAQPGPAPETPRQFADAMVRDGLLTAFEADTLMLGRWRGFLVNGKYRLLQKVGSGGMGVVGLYEHLSLRRRVALKILPPSQSRDADAVTRFYREARAVACLNHPNIVRCHDIDCERDLHFIVLEYIDGSNMHDIVRRHGPLPIVRAAHYVRQAALGLQHAHEAGLVHRDIKPGNILLDRNGVVKLLDMGLARFFDEEEENLSYDHEGGNALGTADYLAPEQVHDSRVDIRADIYGLGVTFYYLLSGKSPFATGTVAQKLIWHQVRQPKPIRALRPEVPQELADIVEKMMAKDAADRFQIPQEVAEALNPWTQTAIPPPPEAEMPSLDLGPRSSGTSSNNTPISRNVLSPLGIRGSPPTPISRAPKVAAPRTTLRAPAASQPIAPPAIATDARQVVPAPPTPQPAIAPAAGAPPGYEPAASEPPPKPGAEEKTDLADAAAGEPEQETASAAAVSAAEAPASAKGNDTKAKAAMSSAPAPVTPRPAGAKAEASPPAPPKPEPKAPTKIAAARKTVRPPDQPAPPAAKKMAGAPRQAPAAPQPKAMPPKAKTKVVVSAKAQEDSSAGNLWIVIGASILALGLGTLLWSLL